MCSSSTCYQRKIANEWLKRVGTPARLESLTGAPRFLNAMNPGSDYTVMFYYCSEGGGVAWTNRGGRQAAGTFAGLGSRPTAMREVRACFREIGNADRIGPKRNLQRSTTL